jgi:hypothetical protein
MTHSSSSSSSSSGGSESEAHQKGSRKEKKDKKGKKDKKDKKDKKAKKATKDTKDKKDKKQKSEKQKHKDKDKDNKSKHGESSGLNALGVIRGVHKSEDHEKDGGQAAHVPAASVNLQHPHALGTTHATMLLHHHSEHSSIHGASSARASGGHSDLSVSQSSGFSSSGNRVPLQAGDRLPSFHETGPAPFLDADGGPVFIGSALCERSVHPCKIVPNVRDLDAFFILLHINNNAVTPTLSRTLQW